MTDIALRQFSAPGEPPSFDIVLEGHDLATDDGLHTAVVLSLFCDARARDDDVISDGTAERRGWWADDFATRVGDTFGSRQWLLGREKQTQSTLARAKEYAEEALQWLIADGVARSVDVSAYVLSPGVLGLEIAIARANDPVARFRFDAFWGRQ